MQSAKEMLDAMQCLKLAPLHAITSGQPILILAPHPDDESLGCGGLIASCCAAGLPPFVLVLTDGAGSHPNSAAYGPARLTALRQAEARAAVALLGLPPGRIAFLGLPDTRAPTQGPAFDTAATEIVLLCQTQGLRTILAPWRHDPHCDHEAAHLMAQEAAARAGLRHLAYPVWGWTLPDATMLSGPAPQGFRLDIAAHLPAKRRAIQAHASQYTGLISDDPAGFRLPPNLLSIFNRDVETFLTCP